LFSFIRETLDRGESSLRDVRATAQLYQKIEPTILPLFTGGG